MIRQSIICFNDEYSLCCMLVYNFLSFVELDVGWNMNRNKVADKMISLSLCLLSKKITFSSLFPSNVCFNFRFQNFCKETKERAYHVNEIFSQKIIVTTEMAIIFCTAMRQKKSFSLHTSKTAFLNFDWSFPETNKWN